MKLATTCSTLLVSSMTLACNAQNQTGAQVEVNKVLTIVEKGSSSIGFYTEEGQHLKSLKLDTFPHEMRFSPDRKFAYITNNGSLRYTDTVEGGNTISVVNLQQMEKEEDIILDPYRRPHAIDIDPVTGYLAVGVERPDQILLIDPVKRKILKTFDNYGKTPHMVTISREAKWLFVSNIHSSNLVIINTDTGEHYAIDIGFKPQESVLSPDESILYVGCDEYISVIDVKLRKEVNRVPGGANRLELIDDGQVLVFSSNRNGIGFADARRHELICHLDIPYKPYSIHVSEDEQYAYVSAEEQNVVYTVDIPSKRIIRAFYPGEGVRPDPVQDFTLDTPLFVDTTKFSLKIPSYERVVIDSNFTRGYQLKAADINGDQKPDLVAVSDRLPEVVWYENPGWEKHVLSTQTTRNIDISPYDIDRDGDLDFALASGFNAQESTRGGYVSWLENPGAAVYSEWAMHWIDSLPTAHRLRWMDVNGDGIQELLNLPLLGVGATPDDSRHPLHMVYYTIPQNPKADRWPVSVIDSSLHLAHGLQVTRWDDDLREDIITASNGGLTLFHSTSSGWKKTLLTAGKESQHTAEKGASEVSVGKLGDHSKRFLASIEPWHGNEVVIYTKNKDDSWVRQVIDTSFHDGHALQCFDLNYDGFDEVIAGHRGEDYNLYIYRYRPEEDTWTRMDLDRGGMSAAGIHVFDANLDGIPDIAACGSHTENVVLYVGKSLESLRLNANQPPVKNH